MAADRAGGGGTHFHRPGGNFPLCLSAGAGQLRGNSYGVECAAGSKDRGEANAQCAVQAAGEVRGGTGAEWYPRGQRTHTDNADAEYPLPSV